jgi:hypothetical protein
MRGQSQYETQVRYGTYSRPQCARLPCAAEYPVRGASASGNAPRSLETYIDLSPPLGGLGSAWDFHSIPTHV